MNTKLTLSIEKDVIKKAKKYARHHRRSLSNLVENYLKLIVKRGDEKSHEYPPIVKSLLGSIKTPKDYDYKKALEEEILKRHL